jgi:hypothetical protein
MEESSTNKEGERSASHMASGWPSQTWRVNSVYLLFHLVYNGKAGLS